MPEMEMSDKVNPLSKVENCRLSIDDIKIKSGIFM